jgi:hypothetical protein
MALIACSVIAGAFVGTWYGLKECYLEEVAALLKDNLEPSQNKLLGPTFCQWRLLTCLSWSLVSALFVGMLILAICYYQKVRTGWSAAERRVALQGAAELLESIAGSVYTIRAFGPSGKDVPPEQYQKKLRTAIANQLTKLNTLRRSNRYPNSAIAALASDRAGRGLALDINRLFDRIPEELFAPLNSPHSNTEDLLETLENVREKALRILKDIAAMRALIQTQLGDTNSSPDRRR